MTGNRAAADSDAHRSGATAGAPGTPIIVFARAPVPGEAKTRLAPRLGAAGAARLHARLAEQTLETALAAGVGPVELCCAPDRSHAFFARCAERLAITLAEQGPGDLGARMHAAFARIVPVAGAALLLGTDCPALSPGHLREAADALASGDDAVFVPAEDGGYVLIGLARVSPDLFAGIEWGGSAVMVRTRERLAELGWRWRELDELWDVDRPEDLARLAACSAGRRLLDEAARAEAPE